MKQVIAMHGWCSDGRDWKPWQKIFKSNGWLWCNAERGYSTVTPSEPVWNESKTENSLVKRVLITHSLGTHLISRKLLTKATHIVFINSFGRFVPIGKESRAIKLGLQGMLKKLETKQEKDMIRLFWEKACSPNKINEIKPAILNSFINPEGIQKLKTDLNLLVKTECLPKTINKKAKALVIDGGKDKIVLPKVKDELLKELSGYLYNNPKHWLLKDEGHLIVLKQIIEQTMLWLESS